MSVSLGKRAPKAFGPEALDHEQGGSRETLYGGIRSFEQLRVWVESCWELYKSEVLC